MFYCFIACHLCYVNSRSTFTADVSAHLLPFRPSLSLPPQETRSGCQVRSSPRPPGTWSESLSASASPSASKVQTWQPCHSTPVGSPANKTIQKKNKTELLADHKRHLVDERAQQISLDVFVAARHGGRDLSQSSSALIWNSTQRKVHK